SCRSCSRSCRSRRPGRRELWPSAGRPPCARLLPRSLTACPSATEWERSCSRLLPGSHGEVDVAAERGARLEDAVAEGKREVDVGGKAVVAPVPMDVGQMPGRREREIDAMDRGSKGRTAHLAQAQ